MKKSLSAAIPAGRHNRAGKKKLAKEDRRARFQKSVIPGTERVISNNHRLGIITLHIEIAPETEAKLAAQAAAEGISLPEYLRRLLEREATPVTPRDLSAAARAAYWRDSAKRLSTTAPLSDQAISRESIYGDQPI